MRATSIQIWREDRDGGAIFARLQGLAQRHMDVVARACDARSAVMLRDEPGGQALNRVSQAQVAVWLVFFLSPCLTSL